MNWEPYFRIPEEVDARALDPDETLESLLAAGVRVDQEDAELFDRLPRGMLIRNPDNHLEVRYVPKHKFDRSYENKTASMRRAAKKSGLW